MPRLGLGVTARRGASPALLASLPSLDLDFLKQGYQMSLIGKAFADIFTFSRASSGTRINSAGVMETVAANQPRFDYEPADIPILGPELVTNGDFSNGTTGWVVGAGATIAAVGYALQITNTGTNGWATNQANVAAVVGKSYRYSVSNKGSTQITFYIRDGVGSNPDMVGISLTPGQTKTDTFVSNTTGLNMRVFCIGAAASVAITDDVSIKEVTGYAVLKGDPKGLLIEEQRTNLLTYSNDFTNAAWTKGPNLTANGLVGDLLGIPSYEYVSQGSGNSYLSQNASVTVGSVYAAKFLTDVPAGTMYVRFNGPGTTSFFATKLIAPGVYLATWSGTIPAGTTSLTFHVGLVDAVAGTKFRVAAAQLELGSFSTSYIPTTSAQVTRAVDVCSINTLSPWYNAAEGTLFAEFGLLAHPPALFYPGMAFSGAGSTEKIGFYCTPGASIVTGMVRNGGAAQYEANAGSAAFPSSVKAALAFKAGNFRLATNGALGTLVSSGTVPTVTSLKLTVLDNPMNCYLRRVRHFPRRIADSQLQGLTA